MINQFDPVSFVLDVLSAITSLVISRPRRPGPPEANDDDGGLLPQVGGQRRPQKDREPRGEARLARQPQEGKKWNAEVPQMNKCFFFWPRISDF